MNFDLTLTKSPINLKKLSSKALSLNSNIQFIDVKELIDAIIKLDTLDHKIFQCYFIKNLTYKQTSIELSVSTYRVKQSVYKTLKTILNNEEVFR